MASRHDDESDWADREFTDWATIPDDPEPSDLGYDPMPLNVTESSGAGGHLVILPHDEDHLREEAFIVSDSDDVANLENMR